jgi:hypothetical protein
MKRILFFAIVALLAGAAGLHAQGPQALTMTNAFVVSVDPAQRIMVIKNTDGRQQTVELDDQIAGFGGIRAGDEVVLSLRKGPGRDRIMAMEKSAPTTTSSSRTTTSTTRTTTSRPPTTTTQSGASGTATSPALPPVKEETRVTTSTNREETRAVNPNGEAAAAARNEAALGSYNDRVAALAQQASEVDRLWGEAVRVCNATVDANYNGREWVSLWDRQVRLDTSTGACREILNQVITAGEAINSGMASAQDAAQRAGLSAGDLRDVNQRYSMDWGGWGTKTPDRFTQP